MEQFLRNVNTVASGGVLLVLTIAMNKTKMRPNGPSEPNFDWNCVGVIPVRGGRSNRRHDRQVYQTQGTSENRRRIIGLWP